MSYIDLINAFERWVETNYLPISSQMLWYKLISLFNKCGWSEWITVDNQRLMSIMQIKNEHTFIKCRDNLITTGLLQYRKGKKGSPNQYKINTSIFAVNIAVQNAVNIAVENAVNSADINRLDKDNKKYIKNSSSENDNCNVTMSVTVTESNADRLDKDKNIEYNKIIEIYNFNCPNLPKIQKLTDKRKKAIKNFLKEFTEEQFKNICKIANNVDFLIGKNDRGWKADFDFVIKIDKATSILEGKYSNNKINNKVDNKRSLEDGTYIQDGLHYINN